MFTKRQNGANPPVAGRSHAEMAEHLVSLYFAGAGQRPCDWKVKAVDEQATGGISRHIVTAERSIGEVASTLWTFWVNVTTGYVSLQNLMVAFGDSHEHFEVGPARGEAETINKAATWVEDKLNNITGRCE